MSIDLNRVIGYAPTLEEIMKDLGVTSMSQIRPTILKKCRNLYKNARRNGDLKVFQESPYEFIICDSTEFYKTFVNLGHGNSSMVILDDFSPEFFFLLFKDKIPKKFYPIAVVHESTEYDEIQSGLDQKIAHEIATKKEIKIAKKLHLKKDYFKFLKKSYPGKYKELNELSLVRNL